MDAVWAEEVLRDRGGELSAQNLRALTLLATGDQGKADREYAKRLNRDMDRKAAAR